MLTFDLQDILCLMVGTLPPQVELNTAKKRPTIGVEIPAKG